jgi:DNA-binding NarL/FixJ family response regulator
MMGPTAVNNMSFHCVIVILSNRLHLGNPNKLICRDLNLSEGTVKVHVSAILKALNVRSRAQAVATLARRGISVETLAARR